VAEEQCLGEGLAVRARTRKLARRSQQRAGEIMMANGADPFTASNHSKSTYFGFILTSTWGAWTGCGRRGSAVHWADARFLNGDV
jgi:hypothetical protein